MADFEPVLLRRIFKKASPWLDAYRADGGYRALQKAVNEMTPAQVDRCGQGVRAARPRRRRLSLRAQVDLSAQGPSRPHLHVHQRRRERAMHVQQPHPDGRRSASGARRHHAVLLCDAGQRRPTSTCAMSTAAAYRAHADRPSTSCTTTICSAEHSRQGLSSRCLSCTAGPGPTSAAKRRGLIESLEGKRGWPRIKPPFPAVEGAFRKPTVVNNIETLACVTHIIDRGRRLVQVDRRAARSEEPARRRQLWTETVLHQRPRQQAGLRRIAAGRHCARVGGQTRRRRLEGTQGQGLHPRRHQHGHHDRKPSSICRSISPGPARSAVWGWARPP